MSERRQYRIYYGDLDRLLLECVQPLLERATPVLSHRFWERHYAGGTHLRVTLRGDHDRVHEVGALLNDAARSFMASHPSPDATTYSAERVADLLRQEGDDLELEDLRYRNNTVELWPHPAQRARYLTPDAVILAEDFRHDTMTLAGRILASATPRRDAMLQLYFLNAILVGHDSLPEGAVSYKSHWEGFAATFVSVELLDRIRGSYTSHRESILGLLREVVERWDQHTIADDPNLAAWQSLFQRYAARIRATLAEGRHVTRQPATPEGARQLREELYTIVRRDSEFVRALWSDERFMASLQFNRGFIVARVLTNLLYTLLAAVGLHAIDRMSLCYYAHRAAEDHYGCNLTDILQGNIEAIVRSHADRWAS